ncbi:nuclear transport factor 2 family protein [Gracilibacillus alcaliphilus]|uniref:nuclear transport factor 2 family protein n=1 Tax=Gracilibacillus alcaliphilus TaxID=1401441 RepID=UPI0019560870|nr:DUF4440 domain-containing protein [Gracilibacillus alcaliphilus]MBM7676865.1 hypothetical protein [Gracilibacillus alcaliphilus]
MIEYEKIHLDAGNRRDKEKVLEILHPDFYEFGQSGTIITRQDLEQTELSPDNFSIRNYQVHRLSADSKLCTYQLENTSTNNLSNRSSLWVLHQNQWKLLFHQGTRAEQPADMP